MMALIHKDTIVAIQYVSSRLLSPVAAESPLRFNGRRITGVIDQEWAIQQPVEVHTVPTTHDRRRRRHRLGCASFKGLRNGASIEIGPQAANNPNLPSEVKSTFVAYSWTDPEKQIGTFGLGAFDQPIECLLERYGLSGPIANIAIIDAATFSSTFIPSLHGTKEDEIGRIIQCCQ